MFVSISRITVIINHMTNITKFLIDRKGRVVARFEPVVTPEQIVPEIEALL